jgi:hypothetical protein
LSTQTACNKDVNSVSIIQYLVDNFEQTRDKIFDFFLETYPDCYTTIDDYNGIYMEQLRYFFAKVFEYYKEHNKINISTKIPNARLHYIDIRGYLSYLDCQALYLLLEEISNYFNSLHYSALTCTRTLMIYDSLTIASSEINFLYETLYKIQQPIIIKKINIIQPSYNILSKCNNLFNK